MNIRDIKMGVPRNDGRHESFWRMNGKSKPSPLFLGHVGVSEIYYNHNPLKKKKHLFDRYQLPSGKLT